MKKPALMTTLIAGMLFAGASFASVQTRSEGDTLYGGGMTVSSAAEPYELTGPVQHRAEQYLLWNVNAYTAASGDTVDTRVADDRKMSTDLIYGS